MLDSVLAGFKSQPFKALFCILPASALSETGFPLAAPWLPQHYFRCIIL